MNDQLEKYRDYLVQSERKSFEAYDKGLLTLSGGALGISIVFIRDIIGPEPLECIINLNFLFSAWLCWGITLGGTLISFYISHLALRKTIKQLDDKSIYNELPGGIYTVIIKYLNAFNGIMFLLGMILFVIFVKENMG